MDGRIRPCESWYVYMLKTSAGRRGGLDVGCVGCGHTPIQLCYEFTNIGAVELSASGRDRIELAGLLFCGDALCNTIYC